jgi:hypothetical protein
MTNSFARFMWSQRIKLVFLPRNAGASAEYDALCYSAPSRTESMNRRPAHRIFSRLRLKARWSFSHRL